MPTWAWLVALAAVGAVGFMVGWVLRDRRAPPASVDPARPLAQRTTRAAVDTVDDLVADAIRGIGSWIRTAGTEKPPELRLASDGTITVMFGDLAGSTALNARVGDDTFARMLARHDDRVKVLVQEHGGRVVKTQGDGFMAVFRDPVAGVRCALALRDDTRGRSVGDEALHLRVGLHRGPAVTQRGDVFGEHVAIAARIADHAGADQVVVSIDVREALERADAPGIEVSPHALPVRLKGLAGWHRLATVETAAFG